MNNVAKFMTNAALFTSNVAKFMTNAALFTSNVAKFMTNSALFTSNVAKFMTNSALFISNLAKFMTNAALFTSNGASVPAATALSVHPSAFILSEVIQRTCDLPAHGFGELCINFRSAHVGVTEEFLDAADVHASENEMRGIGVTKHVGRDPLAQVGQL